MKIIEKKENQIVFSAEIEESLANTIRRYLNQIPILAVDELEISKNDSPLYDEVLAHRIGLIPLKVDRSINEKTVANLNLKVKREGNVFSGDLSGNTKVVYPKIPITFLNKNKEIDLVAIARVGRGNTHSKFSPGMMFYRNSAEITMDSDFYNEIKKLCSSNEVKNKGNKIIIIDDKKKEICDVCEGVCNKHGKKADVLFKDELIITLESFGQLSVEDIFKKSIENLKKDLTELNKKISK